MLKHYHNITTTLNYNEQLTNTLNQLKLIKTPTNNK